MPRFKVTKEVELEVVTEATLVSENRNVKLAQKGDVLITGGPNVLVVSGREFLNTYEPIDSDAATAVRQIRGLLNLLADEDVDRLITKVPPMREFDLS